MTWLKWWYINSSQYIKFLVTKTNLPVKKNKKRNLLQIICSCFVKVHTQVFMSTIHLILLSSIWRFYSTFIINFILKDCQSCTSSRVRTSSENKFSFYKIYFHVLSLASFFFFYLFFLFFWGLFVIQTVKHQKIVFFFRNLKGKQRFCGHNVAGNIFSYQLERIFLKFRRKIIK